jgi:cold shock CspA family protein
LPPWKRLRKGVWMPVSTLQMRVHKYIPERLYGFLVGVEGEVFFHLGAFDPGTTATSPTRCSTCPSEGCVWIQMPAPPILGERVEVEVDLASGQGKAPRALRVTRLVDPTPVHGIVDTFDHVRGYGFVKDKRGISYHLHKSEVLDGKIPLTGQQVSFYAGVRQGKPRACHVRVCP